MLSERSRAQKDKDGMVPLRQGSQERPSRRDSKLGISGGGGRGEGDYWLTDEWAQNCSDAATVLEVNNADGSPDTFWDCD